MMEQFTTEAVAEDVARKSLRAQCGLPVAEAAIKKSLDAMVAKKNLRAVRLEMELLAERLRIDILSLTALVFLLALTGGVLAYVHAYVGASIAIMTTLIPGLGIMTKYDRRKAILRRANKTR
jgi:hypothetical protein